MSHSECPHGDLIRLKNGDSLHLECNSECSNTQTEFKWMKITGEQATRVPLESAKEASLSIASVTYSDGGQYMCLCLPDGPECLYNVTSKLVTIILLLLTILIIWVGCGLCQHLFIAFCVITKK